MKMPITPKVFGPEKRNCTFWKWQNYSIKMAQITYASDENERFYRPKCNFGEKLKRLCKDNT